MGLITPNPPPVDPATFMDTPYLDRIKALSRHWVDYGAGLPKYIMFIYIAKMLVFAVVGVLLATLPSGLDPLDPGEWFYEPIAWQKLVIWTMFVEAVGIGGAWGPLCGHFKPMTGGAAYWLRPGTIRMPPWPDRVPMTKGDERTPLDVALYAGFLAALLVALVLPGSSDPDMDALLGANEGLVLVAPVIVAIALLVIVGLRDKTIFLAARGEQWMPALIFFAFFPFIDMIVAAKLLIVLVWFGAGISKVNRHFENVIPPMVSNTPWNPFKSIKRLHYADFPDDLRPSKGAKRLSHIGGAVGELIPPWILLFSQNPTVTAIAAVFMICYHAFITSTFPLAVPLEWNLMFMFITGFLFLGFPNYDGYGLADMDPVLLAVTVVGLLVFPILGELRPDLVSFLPSLRQYSGNWATSMWATAPGAEAKFDEGLVKPARMQTVQLSEMFDPETARVTLHQYLAWRSMHSQGRGLNSVMLEHLGDDIDVYDIREGEISCNAIIGWNFGDGHLHNPRLIEAIQKRCHFEPGEFVVVFAESEPVGNGRQQYLVIDAAVGIVERGSWAVKSAIAEQPWLPNGPIPLEVSWTMPGYERAGRGQPAPAGT
ncbi:MAG: DUF3556 domain-containing protein [Solirubrobacterales bacterium]|nr:DUF3556 domain-containing protein [Solirubrobacterales bacterium]MCB8970008.1 DUF3556 domain-containing protein [Thermoleophilales bacterium]MCO5326981.1 DUF3556 domain-containing protein [Solirubrobacterales bacterium]